MGYAGICGEANVQANSDAYFNAVSLAEIFNVLTNTSCAEITVIDNNTPVVPAFSGRTIPKSTAFVLRGTNATDADGDALSYTWEQIDGVTTNSAHANLPSSTATQGPNYRSKAPSDAKNRYMPELAEVLASNLYPTWEITPDVGRTMRFAYTVRDNNVLGGQTARRDMTVTVSNVAGPFVVTSQDQSDIVWVGGEEQTVTWDVAGTTANGINTSMVNILLSTNGGQSFDTVLLANTPNDGSQTFTVPTNIMAPFCRIMVEAVGNIYYAVNSVDFSLGYIITNDCVTYTGTGNIAIPDNNAAFTTSNATVTSGTTISSVKVSLSATHTYVADLIFKVKSPVGTEVMLWDRQCPNRSGINVVYDDGGSNLVCGNPTRGTYRPEGTLSDFANENPTGTWQLAFSDNEGGDTGRLTAWSLEVCSYTLTPAATAAFGLKDFKLYPNPNKGNFTIAFASASQNPITIGVYDMRGREVYNDSYTNTGLFSSNVNLGNMQQGVYLVTVQDGNRKETRKIVIE
jgi:subtilisin-like proprotein convertase family protein